MTDLATAVRL